MPDTLYVTEIQGYSDIPMTGYAFENFPGCSGHSGSGAGTGLKEGYGYITTGDNAEFMYSDHSSFCYRNSNNSLTYKVNKPLHQANGESLHHKHLL